MNDPALAELARVAAGLTQGALAKQLGKTQAFVSQVERGERDIPSDLLDSWALACQVPSSFFGRRDVPLADSIAGMVHRRRKTLPTKPFNRATAQVKMGCLEVDTLLSEVDVVPALSLPYFPPGTGPADAADALRRAWGVPAGPLPNLTALIESTGTPVLLLDSFHEKHSATSQRGRWFDWLIALNGNHPASRRRFTLAHELGHIVLRHDAEMLLIVDDGLVGQLEAEADAFAAELLMPATEARRELRTADFRRLVALKARWQVSVAFLIRHALDLGLIDRNRRQQLEILLSSQPGGRRREPGEFEGEEPKLVRQVIDALRQDGLSLADIAKMATTTESTLRTRYLGERPPLRVVDDHHSRRTVLELRRP